MSHASEHPEVAVITGAGSGMGRAYALELASNGARLALNDWNADDLDATSAMARDKGAQVLARAFDVSDEAAMRSFAQAVLDAFGPASLVINNAGIEGDGGMSWEIPTETMHKVFEVNFMGVVYGSQVFLPQLREHPRGKLVNVASIFGLIGPPRVADYAASKFAVRGYTECLMAELQDSTVSVHLVMPGGVKTRISRKESGRAFKERFLKTPPEVVAKTVLKAVERGQMRIITGHQSKWAWLASNLLPQWILTPILVRVMRSLEPT